MTMNDLISRDTVTKILNNNRSIRTMLGGVSDILINLMDAIGEIERVPAVEARPVRTCGIRSGQVYAVLPELWREDGR